MYIVEAVLDEASEQPPFARLYRLSTSRRLDIHVPRTKVLVSVTDSATGNPVANAAVNTINRWEDGETGKGGASHNATTDDSGVARLAPLSEGTAEIHVTADGYFKDDPITIAVQNDTARTVPVRLRPAGAGVAVRVILPGGAPAADAELRAVAAPSGLPILWSGRTDADGRVSVARSLIGLILLVRHQAAASHARRLEDTPEQEIQLMPFSPQPLMIRVERRGEPARSAQITVWLGVLPISGPALGFLTRSPSSTSAAGDWVGQHLPQGPLRILASSGSIDAQIAAGVYDALAATVPEPRPNQFVITVVE
jgi:hypothetical protein